MLCLFFLTQRRRGDKKLRSREAKEPRSREGENHRGRKPPFSGPVGFLYFCFLISSAPWLLGSLASRLLGPLPLQIALEIIRPNLIGSLLGRESYFSPPVREFIL